MTITVIRPQHINPAGPIPRYTCLGKQDPNCTATQHGTYSAYSVLGCRCPHAREAKRIYLKRLRENRSAPRFTDGTGTRRRLQALSALGWRWEDMAEHLGTSGQNVQNIARGDQPILTTTAARVRALYGRLSSTPGPSGITRRRAAAKGWAPPLAWDDIDDPNAQPDLGDPDADVIDAVAVRRALDGEHLQLSHTEREHAFRIGLKRGMTPTSIGHALHLSGTTALDIARRVRTTQAA